MSSGAGFSGEDAGGAGLAALIEKEVARLPVEQREAIVLQFYRGLTSSQVAAQTGWTEKKTAEKTRRGLARVCRRVTRSRQVVTVPDLVPANLAVAPPVPFGLDLKVAGIAGGRLSSRRVVEIVQSASRWLVIERVKRIAAITAAVVAVCVVCAFAAVRAGWIALNMFCGG